MPLDPSIILSGKQPEPISPMQSVGGLMQLRGQMADIALRNQQIETSKAQVAEHQAMQAKVEQETRNAQRQYEMKKKLTPLLQDPKFQQRLKNGDFGVLAENGIDQDVAQPLVDGLQKGWQAAAALDTDKAKFHETGRTRYGDLLRDAQTPEQMQEGIRILGADHPELVQQVGAVPSGANFAQWKKDQAVANGVARAILQAGVADREALAKVKTAETEAAQKARVLAGTSAIGLTAKDQAEISGEAATRAEQHRRNVQQGQHEAATAGTGTWSIQEDESGKPVKYNSKTGQVLPISGVQRAGTAAKKEAAEEKAHGPARDAVLYAENYLSSDDYTGPGDEALMEKFFDLAKPSTGFRMTQSQQDMLKNSRGIMGSMEGKARHAISGTWFSDKQRREIVKTMKELAAAKKSGSASPSGPSVGTVDGGYRFKGGDPADAKNWEKVK